MKTLIISDIHIPYHSSTALDCAFNIARQERVEQVIINGDLIDCESLSRYDKRYDTVDFAREIDETKYFLQELRKTFRRARIIYKAGNHEERLETYIMRKAPELAHLKALMIPALLELQALSIEYVNDRSAIQLGKLSIYHGHEIGSAASVNVAISVLRKTLTNTLCGHWHKTQQEILRNAEGHLVGAWISGCLCDLNPFYRPVNTWNHGFAIVTTDSDGIFSLRNYYIQDGRIL